MGSTVINCNNIVINCINNIQFILVKYGICYWLLEESNDDNYTSI